MAAQKKFTKKYREQLLQDAKNGVGLDRYAGSSFPVGGQWGYSRSVSAPTGLLEKMDPADDYVSAVALFEAYKTIPTIEAADPVFWETLAHDELFPYVQKRWPVEGVSDLKTFVLNHWFVTKGMIRHALAGLWWAVKCSYDETAADPYELTRIMFKNYSFRSAFWGASTLIRCKSATLGILSFLKESPELLGNMEIAGRFITNYFNKLGATKQLAYLDRSFFVNELTRIKPEILKLRSREDISGAVASIME